MHSAETRQTIGFFLKWSKVIESLFSTMQKPKTVMLVVTDIENAEMAAKEEGIDWENIKGRFIDKT